MSKQKIHDESNDIIEETFYIDEDIDEENEDIIDEELEK